MGRSSTTSSCRLCEEFRVELHYVPAYSLWVNGLVEGTNTKLLGRLKCMCTLDLGDDKLSAMGWEDLPASWREHLEEAVLTINNQILPALKFSPDELLFGLIINTPQTPLEDTVTPVNEADTGLQMAYRGQLCLDGYARLVDHAVRWKV
jgi:hypothetical protein